MTLKFERARRHLGVIHEAIDEFVSTAYEGSASYCEVDTGNYALKLGEIRHPDHGLAVIVGDFLHNLRSALDHLAFQLVRFPVEDGGDKTPEDKISFPLCDTPASFERSKWKVRGSAPGVEAIIEGLQPYSVAQQPFLWLLHELNNWDKHRVLHLSENTLIEVGFGQIENTDFAEVRAAGELEDDAVLARWKAKSGLDPDVEVGLYLGTEVTFENGPGAGWQVKGALDSMLILSEYALEELIPFIAIP